jgi:hypothetical protein
MAGERLFAASLFLLLLSDLIHQLSMVAQALAEFLEAFAELHAIADLILQLLAQLFADLVAFLFGLAGEFLLLFLELLLVLGALLAHLGDGFLDVSREALMHAVALLFEVRAAVLQTIAVTIQIARLFPLFSGAVALAEGAHAQAERGSHQQGFQCVVFHGA